MVAASKPVDASKPRGCSWFNPFDAELFLPGAALASVEATGLSKVGEGLRECAGDLYDLMRESSGVLVTGLSLLPLVSDGGAAAVTLASGAGAAPPIRTTVRAGRRGSGHGPPQEIQENQRERTFLEIMFPEMFEGSVLLKFILVECGAFAGSLLMGSVGLAPTACCLYALGASWAPAIATGALWRLVTPVFLHASLQHLVMNSIWQMRYGFLVERELGSVRFTALYILSGIFGNLLSAARDPWKMSVGASTSGFGLLGAFVAILLRRWDSSASGRNVGLYQLLLPVMIMFLSAHFDVWGHTGGFLAGLCLFLMLDDKVDASRWPTRSLRYPAFAILALVGGDSLVRLHALPEVGGMDCPGLF